MIAVEGAVINAANHTPWRIQGITTLADATPVSRFVCLHEYDRTYDDPFRLNSITRCVQRTLSNASGHYEFRDLDPSRVFAVIAYDHTGTFDPVVKINLTPERMP